MPVYEIKYGWFGIQLTEAVTPEVPERHSAAGAAPPQHIHVPAQQRRRVLAARTRRRAPIAATALH